MAALIDKIKSMVKGEWSEKKGLWKCSTVIAERKAFLSKKKLTYSCSIRIDETAKTVKFSEMLMESGSGLSTGGDFDSDMSSGFGFKKESYNTMNGPRQETIEEQSKLFGKDYSYTFNFGEVREGIKRAAEEAGYQFEYQILPVK